MYGLVNRALQGLVLQERDDKAWERIAAQASSPISFMSMETYPDSLSLALVGAAAAELACTPAELLRRLGLFWVGHTGKEGYGEMFSLWGTDLRSFLANLDQMHDRVKLTMPHLEPPSFSILSDDGSQVRLAYHSHRDGLAPMVVGLLEGLAHKFSSRVRIEHVVTRDEAGHDEFLVTIEND